MSKKEQEAIDAYKEAGVDLDDLDIPTKPDAPDPVPTDDTEKKPVINKDDEEDNSEKSKKKSIYDEYKEKKNQLKEAQKAQEQMESKYQSQIDALTQTIEEMKANPTQKAKEDTKDEFDALIQQIEDDGGDVEVVKKLRATITEDLSKKFNSADTEELKTALSQFKEWQTQNSQAIAEKKFNDSLKAIEPAIKTIFPNISDDEKKIVQEELRELSSKAEWKDKELDYILFKNKDTISDFVSPKKRGFDSKGRAMDTTVPPTEFESEPDFSKMTIKQQTEWERNYRNNPNSGGLHTDSDGRKIIL